MCLSMLGPKVHSNIVLQSTEKSSGYIYFENFDTVVQTVELQFFKMFIGVPSTPDTEKRPSFCVQFIEIHLTLEQRRSWECQPLHTQIHV